MKEIEKLFENQEFEEIIEKYSDSKKYDEILYVLSSYISLGQIPESYEHYKTNQNILEKTDFIASMNYFLLILALFNNQVIIDKELNRIKNMPYISQQVEEFIKDLDENFKKIRQATDESGDNSDENFNYVEALKSENEDEVIKAIQYIHENFADSINSYSVLFYDAFKERKTFDTAKNLLLIELIQTGFNRDISFIKNGKFYLFKPEELTVTYGKYDREMQALIDIVKKEEKNVNLIDDIVFYFVNYLEANIPTFYSKKDMETVMFCAIKKAYSNVKMNYEDDEVIKLLTINNNLLAEIETFIDKF